MNSQRTLKERTGKKYARRTLLAHMQPIRTQHNIKRNHNRYTWKEIELTPKPNQIYMDLEEGKIIDKKLKDN